MPSPTLTKTSTQDLTLNRVQDELMGKLNPILRTLPSGIGTQPTVAGTTGAYTGLAALLSALAGMGIIKDATKPVSIPVVTGSRGGNAALASLLSALDGLGIIKNSSVP